MIRSVIIACVGLLSLATLGCASQERVIETLPDPHYRATYVQRAGGKSDYVSTRSIRTPSTPHKNYTVSWPNSQTSPRWSPLPLRAVAGESGWIPAVGISPRWRYIVVHHSASETATPSAMDNAHRARGWDELGYHFVIGNGNGFGDGQVFIGSRWKKQKHGAHCKTTGGEYNQFGIGICLMGNFENHKPTERQMQSLARLTAFLQKQCNIPSDRVLTHGGITHKTQCPGKYFSRAELLIRINAYR